MIVLGRVTAPLGVRGWVRIHPLGDDPAEWQKMRRWWLGVEPQWRCYEVEQFELRGRSVAVRFAGVEDRNAAEGLRGLYVAVPQEELPASAAGEYYWADLLGLEVTNLAGDRLGKVTELISTGAHDVLCLSDEEGCRRLLPFVEPVIREVDLDARRIRVEWERDW